MKKRALIGLAASALLAACAAAGSGAGLIPVWTNFADHPKGYLGEHVPQSLAFLPPPPEASSPRGEADLAAYRATRSLERSHRWAYSVLDADIETVNAPGHVFGCALGTSIDIARQPVLMRLLGRVMSDVDEAGKGAKAHYQRPRPFLTDDGNICVAKEDWLVKQGSYPSGHAGTGMAWALILSEMAPERADALMRRGLAVGDSRVVCGVHYPSDVEAGRAVGAATVARLKTDPGFLRDFAVAKAELDRAIAAPVKVDAEECALDQATFSVPAY
jgi:acid phosphatase (class A)